MCWKLVGDYVTFQVDGSTKEQFSFEGDIDKVGGFPLVGSLGAVVRLVAHLWTTLHGFALDCSGYAAVAR